MLETLTELTLNIEMADGTTREVTIDGTRFDDFSPKDADLAGVLAGQEGLFNEQGEVDPTPGAVLAFLFVKVLRQLNLDDPSYEDWVTFRDSMLPLFEAEEEE